MISPKNLKDFVQTKKNQENDFFWIENPKVIVEFVQNTPHLIHHIFLTKQLLPQYLTTFNKHHIPFSQVEPHFLQKISNLKNNREIGALIKKTPPPPLVLQKITLVIETIQDPGNLGTIIRTANWFGVKNIVCSPDSVNVFNPKCIQACMGSFQHTNIYYQDLNAFFEAHPTIPIYAASLQGKSLKNFSFNEKNCFLLLGNESKGISPHLIKKASHQIKIDGNQHQTESLNVAIANAILLFYISNL